MGISVRMYVFVTYKYISFQRTTSGERNSRTARNTREYGFDSLEASRTSQNTGTLGPSPFRGSGRKGRRKGRKESHRQRYAISAVFLPFRVFFLVDIEFLSVTNSTGARCWWNRLTFPVTGIRESCRRPDPLPPSVSRTGPRI